MVFKVLDLKCPQDKKLAFNMTNSSVKTLLIGCMIWTAWVTTPIYSQEPLCTPPPAGLMSWWKAEGNLLDSVGSNNGFLNGNVNYTNMGAGQAFDLMEAVMF
ncbi:MAG: hypothetical protein WDN00_01350 [Limisphaerales bacterium]